MEDRTLTSCLTEALEIADQIAALHPDHDRTQLLVDNLKLRLEAGKSPYMSRREWCALVKIHETTDWRRRERIKHFRAKGQPLPLDLEYWPPLVRVGVNHHLIRREDAQRCLEKLAELG